MYPAILGFLAPQHSQFCMLSVQSHQIPPFMEGEQWEIPWVTPTTPISTPMVLVLGFDGYGHGYGHQPITPQHYPGEQRPMSLFYLLVPNLVGLYLLCKPGYILCKYEYDYRLNHTWDYKKRTLQPCRPDYKSRLYTLYKGLKKRTLHSVNKGQQKQMVDFIKGHYKRLLKPVVDFVLKLT